MYKELYDKFSNWSDHGSIYFYSDPHFNDEDSRKLRINNISDEEQLKRINSVVQNNDTIVILGDIGDTSYVSKIHGYKVLIAGNHDKGMSNYKRKKEIIDGKLVDNHLFDEVYKGVLVIGEKLILSHQPIEGLPPYLINFHGHDHGKWFLDDGRHFNFCAEYINYTPVRLDVFIKNGTFKDIKSIHRLTIDKRLDDLNEKDKQL